MYMCVCMYTYTHVHVYMMVHFCMGNFLLCFLHEHFSFLILCGVRLVYTKFERFYSTIATASVQLLSLIYC